MKILLTFFKLFSPETSHLLALHSLKLLHKTKLLNIFFSKFEDKEFLKAFQLIDGVIQNNQPLFLLVWLGSIISVLVTILSSVITLGFLDSLIIICVCSIYLFGVQGITIPIHLPLNRRIQNLDINNLDKEKLNEERKKFENKWNFYNKIRAGIAIFVSLMLLIIITTT